MPVILAIQDAEIRKTGSKPVWAESSRGPIFKITNT
jgi:hypothetical protein